MSISFETTHCPNIFIQTQQFDSLIIGSGTSAYYAERGLSAGGQKVAVVDKRPYGGTCDLRGCQPKKYLTANAETVSAATHLTGWGIEAAPNTDWPAYKGLSRALAGKKKARPVSF